ncbi:MAG: hypothetical protein WA581_09440 [Candidatus Acidiferrales bacterium]
MIGFANRYLDALEKHDPSGLPLAARYKFTENGQHIKLGQGLWYQAGEIKYRQYMADPDRDSVEFWGALEESDLPTLLFLRLKVVDHKLTEIETIVNRLIQTNDELAARVQNLKASQDYIDSVLPIQHRSRKAKLIQVANAYFDALMTHPPNPIPFAPDCARTENGMVTSGKEPGCADQFFKSRVLDYIGATRDRRFYITDVERGQVQAMFMMDCPGNLKTVEYDGKVTELQSGGRRPREVLLSEMFKVVNGQIERIQAFHVNNLPFGYPSGW